MRKWGVHRGVAVADAGYGVATGFRRALRSWQLTYVLGIIMSDTGFWLQEVEPEVPAFEGRGGPRTRDYNVPDPLSATKIAHELPDDAWQQVTWRQGSKGALTSRFAAVRAQPSHGHGRDKATEPMGWLLIEWPEDVDTPAKF